MPTTDLNHLTYSPGSWVCLAGQSTWLLADLDPRHELVAACWALVKESAGIEQVLGTILQAGFSVVNDFAIASLGATGVRVILRGSAHAMWSEADTPAVLMTAEDAPTWREHFVADTNGVLRLSHPAARADAWLPLLQGVVVADSLAIPTGSPDAAQQANPAELSFVPVVPESLLSTSVVRPDLNIFPAPEVRTTAPILEGDVVQPPIQAEVRDPRTVEEDEDAVSGDYDHLFGATEDGVQDKSDLAGTADAGSYSFDHPAESSAPEPDDPGRHYKTLLPSDYEAADLIDASPEEEPHWSPAPEIRAAPAPIQFDEAPAMEAVSSSSAADSSPTVLAARCPAGHLSPAHAGRCRVCQLPVSPQAPLTIARPILGVLRFSNGDVVTLDKGVIMGRAPQVPEDRDDRPNVMQLESRNRDVSRSHVEVSIDGWHVFVEDLGSTNGTIVVLPGLPAQQLRPHDQQIIEPGTVVSLTDDLNFVFEIEP